MSYPVTLNEEDFDLFRIARLLDRKKVLKLLKIIYSKGVSIDALISYTESGVKTEERGLNKEALSFILRVMAEKFPEIKIPPKLAEFIPPVELVEEPQRDKKEVKERVKKGEIIPQAEYKLPIIESLVEMGGSGRMSNVLDRVYGKIKDRLRQKDFEMLASGTAIRWKNRAQWERQKLKSEGYLKKDSPRGIWEITDEGRKLYERLKQRK
jgi:hypothetical protein